MELEPHLEQLRRRYMLAAMERSNGVQTRAAELLGMTFRSFRYFGKKYDLARDMANGAETQDRETAATVVGTE
jgi:two-component system response regulator PilR (NtrC family)